MERAMGIEYIAKSMPAYTVRGLRLKPGLRAILV
jgi:hypothetical protein